MLSVKTSKAFTICCTEQQGLSFAAPTQNREVCNCCYPVGINNSRELRHLQVPKRPSVGCGTVGCVDCVGNNKPTHKLTTGSAINLTGLSDAFCVFVFDA